MTFKSAANRYGTRIGIHIDYQLIKVGLVGCQAVGITWSLCNLTDMLKILIFFVRTLQSQIKYTTRRLDIIVQSIVA